MTDPRLVRARAAIARLTSSTLFSVDLVCVPAGFDRLLLAFAPRPWAPARILEVWGEPDRRLGLTLYDELLLPHTPRFDRG